MHLNEECFLNWITQYYNIKQKLKKLEKYIFTLYVQNKLLSTLIRFSVKRSEILKIQLQLQVLITSQITKNYLKINNNSIKIINVA